MSPRKEQIDWKMGVKQCPCGQPNHLDETYCVNCGFGFEGQSSRRPRTQAVSKSVPAVVLATLAVLIAISISKALSSTETPPALAQGSLAERVRFLERKVEGLEKQLSTMDDRLTKVEQPVTESQASKSEKQAEHDQTDEQSAPSVQVLVVQVERGNVRAGPGMNYEVIDTVQAGQIIEGPFERENGWFRYCCVDDGKFGWVAGSLVRLKNHTDVANQKQGESSNYNSITLPPVSLNADPLYQKYLNVGGVPLLSLENVPDEELFQARDIMLAMIKNRPDLLKIMVAQDFRVGLYNPLKGDLTQIPELVNYDDSRFNVGVFYRTNDGAIAAAPASAHGCNRVLIHEFAHMIDYAMQWRDYGEGHKNFVNHRAWAYQDAMAAGLWEHDTYAQSDDVEYFARIG